MPIQNMEETLQAAEKVLFLSFREKRGISLRFNCKKTKKSRFLASLGMTEMVGFSTAGLGRKVLDLYCGI